MNIGMNIGPGSSGDSLDAITRAAKERARAQAKEAELGRLAAQEWQRKRAELESRALSIGRALAARLEQKRIPTIEYIFDQKKKHTGKSWTSPGKMKIISQTVLRGWDISQPDSRTHDMLIPGVALLKDGRFIETKFLPIRTSLSVDQFLLRTLVERDLNDLKELIGNFVLEKRL